MGATIDTERYCWAFETWASLPRRMKEDGEEALVRGVCVRLRERFPGVHEIRTLCDAFAAMLEVRDDEADAAGRRFLARSVLVDITKSCLLSRLIYGGEPLRTRRCPLHQGHWSVGDEPCPHGCDSGFQHTGWIAE
jgi:hypothetical protein